MKTAARRRVKRTGNLPREYSVFPLRFDRNVRDGYRGKQGLGIRMEWIII